VAQEWLEVVVWLGAKVCRMPTGGSAARLRTQECARGQWRPSGWRQRTTRCLAASGGGESAAGPESARAPDALGKIDRENALLLDPVRAVQGKQRPVRAPASGPRGGGRAQDAVGKAPPIDQDAEGRDRLAATGRPRCARAACSASGAASAPRPKSSNSPLRAESIASSSARQATATSSLGCGRGLEAQLDAAGRTAGTRPPRPPGNRFLGAGRALFPEERQVPEPPRDRGLACGPHCFYIAAILPYSATPPPLPRHLAGIYSRGGELGTRATFATDVATAREALVGNERTGSTRLHPEFLCPPPRRCAD
jgi:hypothetical protein